MRAVPLIVAAACAVALLGPPVTAARGPELEAEPAPQGTRPPGALDDATEARLIADGDDRALGMLLAGKASAAYNTGQRAAAAALWRQALAAFERTGDAREQANVLYNLSFAERDDSAALVRSLDRALELARGAGAAELEGQILQRLGDEAFLQGQFAAAITHVERAVGLLERSGSPARLARALTSLGRVYRVHGQHDRAVAIYRRGLALHEATNDVTGIAQSLNALATGLRRLGRLDEGLLVAQRGVGMLDPNDRTGALAFALNTVGTLLSDLDRPGDALAAVDRALAVSPHPSEVVMLLASRAVYLSRLGRHAEAVDAAARALTASESAGVRPTFSPGGVLAHVAYVRAAASNAADALDDSARAIALVDEQRQGTLPHDVLRAGFDETTQWVYGQHVRLLVGAGRGADALEAAERARARAFTDLLATRQIVGPDRLPSGSVSIVATAGPTSLGEIRAQATRLKTTVLAYWVHRDETLMWAVAPGGDVWSARVPVTERRLTALVGAAASPSAESRVYRELHDLLVAPLASRLPRGAGQRLTIVPHGPLFRLSFAALKSPTGRYLAEDHALHYAPSIGVLARTAAARPAGTALGAFLVVADPTRSPAGRADDDELPPLPGALAEGRMVAAIGRVPTEALLVRAAATEDRVRALAGGRRVLHFATHAVVSDDHPLDSFLALAGSGTAHEADGRLTAEEVYGLRLDADLVVLSGCRTAGGRVTGDGITGLARAFFYAGTPALVASLWELPDTAGGFILPRFYRRWQRSGDKAAALQSAQVAFLRALRAGTVTVNTPAGRFTLSEHPSLWAGLVLIGEP